MAHLAPGSSSGKVNIWVLGDALTQPYVHINVSTKPSGREPYSFVHVQTRNTRQEKPQDQEEDTQP